MSDTHNAPDTTPAPEPSITEPSREEILAFDPFGPKPGDTEVPSKDGSTGEAGQSAEVEGGQPGEAAPQPAPAQPPTPATTPVQAPPQADLQQITQAIRDAVKSGQPPAVETPPAPRYNLGLPPEMLTALRSEDPAEFGTAMHAVVNGIANKVWTDFQESVQKELLPQVGNIVQAHIASLQQQAQVAQDFYGKHKALGAPATRPLVQQAGVVVAQRRMAMGQPLTWSPELADEIAEEVYRTLPALRPAAPPAPKPNGGKTFATGAGARPAATGQKTPADEMRELLKT